MADESGANRNPEKDRPSSSPSLTSQSAAPRLLILLLAEDNLPDALLVKEAVKAENLPLEVYIVADGERAVDFISRAENDPNAPRPDLLLLDINLPRVDGFEVLRRIRASEKFRNLPVVVVTSSDSPSDRREAAALGARYFRKPVTYDEFIQIGPFVRKFFQENGLL